MKIIKTQKALNEVMDFFFGISADAIESGSPLEAVFLRNAVSILNMANKYVIDKPVDTTFNDLVIFLSEEYTKLFNDVASGKVVLPYDDNPLDDFVTNYLDDTDL